MKIALVVTYRYYRPDSPQDIVLGMVTYTRHLAKALVDAGHEVHVLAFDGPGDGEVYEFEGSTVHQLGDRYTDWTELRVAEVIHAWLMAHPMDVVESHNGQAPLLVEILVGGTPCVIRSASDLFDDALGGKFDARGEGGQKRREWAECSTRQQAWSRYLMEKLSLKNADLVIAAGAKAAAMAEAAGQSQIEMLPLGIPRIHKWKQGKGLLVSVSRFDDPRKGGEFVQQLLTKLPAGFPVTVIGEATTERVRELLSGSGRQATWLTNAVTDQELQELYAEHAAVLVTTKSESFGLCLLEPLAHGKPVLCWDQPDPTKREWPLWTLGRAGDMSRVSEAVKLALDSDPKSAVAKDGRERRFAFAQRHLWSELVPRYEAAYERAMANALVKGRTRSW